MEIEKIISGCDAIFMTEKEKKKRIKSLKIRGRRRHLRDKISLEEAYELLGMKSYEPLKVYEYLERAKEKAGEDIFLIVDLQKSAKLVREYYFVNPFEYKEKGLFKGRWHLTNLTTS